VARSRAALTPILLRTEFASIPTAACARYICRLVITVRQTRQIVKEYFKGCTGTTYGGSFAKSLHAPLKLRPMRWSRQCKKNKNCPIQDTFFRTRFLEL
jgi:hypothetical protein